MFAQPRPKKTLVPPPKKRKTQSDVEEVKFDFDAREDYLTGFHKRKVQRQKYAQEQAQKKEREERIQVRKQAREDRQREVEEHVATVNKILQESQAANSDDDQEIRAEDFEEWNGIEDEEQADAAGDVIHFEDEYIDEDKYTTVKVEAVGVSRDGLEKLYDSDQDNKNDEEEEDADKDGARATNEDEAKAKTKKEWPKKKKQKFRYEQKFDRQNEAKRQKARNKAKGRGRD